MARGKNHTGDQDILPVARMQSVALTIILPIQTFYLAPLVRFVTAWMNPSPCGSP